MLEATKIERQLYILSLLSEYETGLTANDILNHLRAVDINITKKTLERDIDDLSLINFPITEEKRGSKMYYQAMKFTLSNIAFTSSELLSIYFMKEVVHSYSGLEIGKKAASLLDRFIEQLPGINREYINTINRTLKVNPVELIEDNVDGETLETVQNASALDRKIKISYEPFNGVRTENRVLDPYYVELHDGCYHLVAFCHLRNSMREFRISRMTDVEILDELFVRKKDVYEEFKARRFNKLFGEKKILLKIRFTGNAARFVMEYERQKADRVTPEASTPGSVIFEKATTMTPEIKKWVLSYGSEAEVLEPTELKEEIRYEVKRMMGKSMK